MRHNIDRNVIDIGGDSSLREFSTILAKRPSQLKYTYNFKGIVTVKAPESDSSMHFVEKNTITNITRMASWQLMAHRRWSALQVT